MKKIFVFTFLVFTFLLSCQQDDFWEMTEIEKKAVKDSVTHTLHNYYADIREFGLNAEFNYLDSSTNFFWVPPGYSRPISFKKVAAVIRQNALRYTMVDNTFDTLQVIPLTRKLATYTGRLRSSITDTSGNTSTYTLMETGIMIKQKRSWKLLSGQTSLLSQ